MPTAHDALDIITDGNENMLKGPTHVKPNLPECQQYVELVRDCCSALGLQALPPTVTVGKKPSREPIIKHPGEVVLIGDDSSSMEHDVPRPLSLVEDAGFDDEEPGFMDIDEAGARCGSIEPGFNGAVSSKLDQEICHGIDWPRSEQMIHSALGFFKA